MLSTAENPQHHRKTPLYLNPFLSIENPTGKVAVSRRKHQKSRRGCTTCKRRHIRCDEEYPRCRNCVKHQSPCAYPDAHHEASAEVGVAAPPDAVSTVHELAASSDGDVANDSDSVPVTPLAEHKFRVEPASWEMNPRSLDPYLAATIPITAAQREELTFYTEHILSLAMPISPIREAWNRLVIPLAVAEPAVLHGILATTSSNMQPLRNKPLSESLALIHSHKMAAMSLINQKLNSVRDATQIPTIAAILLLVGQEIMLDHDVHAVRAHMLGLKNLIRLRGGFEGLPWPMTQYIFVVDLGYAAICRSLPIFSPISSPTLTSAKSTFVPSEQYLNGSFLTQRYSAQLNPWMLEVYRNFSLVLTFQEYALETLLTCKPNKLSQEEVATYDSLRIPTLYSLLSFFADRDAGEDMCETVAEQKCATFTPIQAICRVVVPIVALQDQFLLYRRSAYTVTMMDSLYQTLQYEIDLEMCWSSCADVMIWATMFGIYLSRGIEEQKEVWFLKELVRGVRRKKGQMRQLGESWKWEWDAVRIMLRNFYWCERFYAIEFKEICEQVTPAISLPGSTDPSVVEKLTLAAASTSGAASQSSSTQKYAELIRCFAPER